MFIDEWLKTELIHTFKLGICEVLNFKDKFIILKFKKYLTPNEIFEIWLYSSEL